MSKRMWTTAAAVIMSSAAATTALAADKGVAIGQAAPGFTLQNQDGKNVSLSSFAGHVVVLEWTNPECPFVQRQYAEHTMTTLANKFKPEGVVWLAVNSSYFITNAVDKTWADAQHIGYPILNDASGAVGHAYGATNTPDMFVIDKTGKLVYKGAIDNDRDGDKTGSDKINYVDQAVSQVIAGNPVSVPLTTPYGCSVKYSEK